MPTSALSVQNFYETTLSSGISSSDTTIPLNTGPTVDEGYLIIEPENTTNREIIYFTSKSSNSVTCPSVGAGRGQDGTSAISHSSGATVRMVVNAQYWKDLKSLFTTTPQGWTSVGYAPNTVTYNGNGSYDLVFNSTDLTSTLSPGMRLRTTRTVAAPNQCTSLNGSSQYWNKTSPSGITFTDDFVGGAWIKLSSYAQGVVISRHNGTSGWVLRVEANGQISLLGYNAGSGNASYVQSYQSVPLNKWTHVAAQLDMSAFTATSTTSYVMINGVDVPVSVARIGTNPTALIQAGNLEVGSTNGGTLPFAGKIAQAFVSSAKITQANVRTLISQGLTASLISTHSIASAYSFSNSANDLNTTNANNLTAQGSATATNADSPFGTQGSGLISTTLDYGIVQAATFSTNTTVTVQTPNGSTIPTSGGVSAVDYSVMRTPYGFPSAATSWRLITLIKTATTTTSNATYGAFSSAGFQLTVPIGSWVIGWQADTYTNVTTAVSFGLSNTALTGMTLAQGSNTTSLVARIVSPSAAAMATNAHVQDGYSLAAAVAFVMYTLGATTSAGLDGTVRPAEIFAENAYI